jgi:lysophospholipase L1-like esterase
VRLSLALAAAALLLAGCSASPADESGSDGAAASQAAAPERYVALGDSFTSGPFVPTTDLASGCFRSSGNYPSLLARRLEVADFVDVSCAGARTRDLPGRQTTLADARVPAQLRALDEGTTLVTVGIGGNDYDFYGRLTDVCIGLRDSDAAGSPCRASLTSGSRSPAELVTRIGRNVERVLGEVRDRAPAARVVLVGYPRIAPSNGTCPGRLPYADGDVRFGDEVQRALNEALRGAADRAGVEFLDMYAASRGHDVCSRAAYVQGARTDRSRALAFHPLPRGMRAVADELETLLSR